MRGATRSWSAVTVVVVPAAAAATTTTTALFAMARAAGELDGQAFSHEVGSMEGWDNVPGVHGVLVLNETEAIHEFDFGDFASTMRGEMRFDVSLSSIPGQIAQVQAGRRHLSHCVCWRDDDVVNGEVR